MFGTLDCISEVAACEVCPYVGSDNAGRTRTCRKRRKYGSIVQEKRTVVMGKGDIEELKCRSCQHTSPLTKQDEETDQIVLPEYGMILVFLSFGKGYSQGAPRTRQLRDVVCTRGNSGHRSHGLLTLILIFAMFAGAFECRIAGRVDDADKEKSKERQARHQQTHV